jgi:DNA gyrase/topoisomerase IV subunit B
VEKKINEYESVEVALQYVDDISARLMAFANNIYTSEGGTHTTGFKAALTRMQNPSIQRSHPTQTRNLIKPFKPDDIAPFFI